MATSRVPAFQIIAGFLGRGLLLGVFGSYLAALVFLNVSYLILATGIAFLGGTPWSDNPELALLRYTVPLGLVVGCAVGYAWERSARRGYRWWRISVSGWTGLLLGGFPVSIVLMLASLYSLVIGFLPGILAGLVWALVIIGFTLARFSPLDDPEKYRTLARRLSTALMLFVGPLALIVGWGLIFGQEAFDNLFTDLFTDTSAGWFDLFYLAIGLSAALVAWLLTPCLTDWYVRESGEPLPPDTQTTRAVVTQLRKP